MDKVKLAPLLHALSGAGALMTSLYTQTDLLASVSFIKPLGLAIFGAGMLVLVAAMVYLKRAFLGDIEPATDRLITAGPYRWIRHPLYLGMFVAVIGSAMAFRSLWGMLITLGAFIPAGLWRARLEEVALRRKFGAVWEDYARQTGFILPRVC